MHTVPDPSADGLLTLLAVARTGRYTAAADLLGINHTTASRRVAALEHALGGALLARAAGGWELTDLGRTAVRAAERIEATLQDLHADTDDDLHGTVRIAATDGFSARVVAPAVARLGRTHPRLSVDLLTVTRRAPSTRSGWTSRWWWAAPPPTGSSPRRSPRTGSACTDRGSSWRPRGRHAAAPI
ncbi:hypothetical protein MTP03_06620 [Tsukamurella sp. PLM1]|nr:hypothetical protein MTP03_06620 [Tsukamurella sp. PLM1]